MTSRDPIPLFRAGAVVFIVMALLSLANGVPFAPGVSVWSIPFGVALWVVPPLIVGLAIAVRVRRRAPNSAGGWVLRVVVLVAQAGWTTTVAWFVYALSGLFEDEIDIGWAVALVAYGTGIVLLVAAWVAEDRLSRRPARAARRSLPVAPAG